MYDQSAPKVRTLRWLTAHSRADIRMNGIPASSFQRDSRTGSLPAWPEQPRVAGLCRARRRHFRHRPRYPMSLGNFSLLLRDALAQSQSESLGSPQHTRTPASSLTTGAPASASLSDRHHPPHHCSDDQLDHMAHVRAAHFSAKPHCSREVLHRVVPLRG